MADNQVNWIGEKVEPKGIYNDVEISKEEKDAIKNAIIELAHGVWADMGLSNEQIAAGIATMNIESSFNPLAEQTLCGKTYIGLGQFDDGTWDYAVDLYNKKSGETLDSTAERYDILSQIKVMGSYMKDTIYRRVDIYHNDDSLKDYSIQEVAYGMWNQGAWSEIETLKTFLEGTDNDQFMNETSDLYGWFNDTYDAIDAELQLRDAANENLDNAELQAQQDEANKTLWDVVIEELKKFLDKSSTQDIIQQFIGQQSPESDPLNRDAAWQIEKAETGENPDESLER